MRFSLVAVALAAVAPALASPLDTRQAANANCQTMVDYQFPSQKSDFTQVCNGCYDIAAKSCSSVGAEDTRSCTATRILAWSTWARARADQECSGKAGTASAAMVCTSGKIDEWIKADGCKPPVV